MEEKNLIVVKQLPIIEEQLRLLGGEIDKKVEKAKNLVATDDGVKELRKYRAENKKDFQSLELQRKSVKEQIEKPYKDFEKIYKEYVSDKFLEADKILKEKIDEFESELKIQKEEKIRAFFEEYKEFKNIDFVLFENLNLNINLSTTEKSLKEQVKTFLDKVSDDLKLIETQDHKEEVLIEYKKSLDVSYAVTTVVNRHKELEELKIKNEEAKIKLENEKKAVEKVEEVLGAPKVVSTAESETKHLILDFDETEENLRELVRYLKDKNYNFKQIYLVKREDGGYDYE